MKGQKQSRVDNLEKRMAAVANILQQLINEMDNLKTMTLGNYSLTKNLQVMKKLLKS